MTDTRREPRFLSRTDAAAYLGVSPRTFDSEVAAGLWPKPIRRGLRGGHLTWDIRALDLALLWHLYAHGAVLYAPGIQWSMRCVPRGVEW